MITELTANQIQKINTAESAYWTHRHPAISKWEGSFLEDIGRRFSQYGSKMSLSEKQEAVLDRIVAKVS